MLKYCIAALAFLAVCSAGAIQIQPRGVVEGLINCGSNGTIVQVRVTDCTRVPCRLVTGSTYAVEIDFIPSRSHPGLDLKVVLIHDGESYHIIDGSVPDSAVTAGRQYTFNYPVQVTGFIQGLSDLRIEINGNVDFHNEVCGIAGINVVPA